MLVELLSVGYGILVMLGYGCSDFLSKRAVKGAGYYRLGTYSQLVALVPVILIGIAFRPPLPSSPTTILLVVASAVSSFLSMALFYRGLEVSKASVITPIVSTYAVVAIVLSFAVLGETLSLPQIACIAITLAGVVTLTLRSDPQERSNAGIPWAMGAMFATGLGAVLLKLVSENIGEIGALFFNRILMVLTFATVGLLFLRSHFRPANHVGFPFKTIILIGIAEFAAFFFFVIGVSGGMVSLVATLGSASPVVTVVLAQAFLKERLARVQKLAAILVMAGIVLLSVVST
jgi:drug/metabolite transporter (DMT)-like permease